MQRSFHTLLIVALCAAAGPARTDDFTLNWWTLDAGGGLNSSGGGFELSGTIAQPDASTVVMTGGGYELAGGFWAAPPATPQVCPGDSNCDGYVSWRDIDYFVAGMNDDVAAWTALFPPPGPTCLFANNDANGDGTVTWRDIDALVALMNTPCP